MKVLLLVDMEVEPSIMRPRSITSQYNTEQGKSRPQPEMQDIRYQTPELDKLRTLRSRDWTDSCMASAPPST